MTLFHLHHRDTFKPSFLRKADAPMAEVLRSAEKKKAPEAAETEKKSPEERIKAFAKEYDPEKYKRKTRGYLRELFQEKEIKDVSAVIDKMVRESLARYKTLYDRFLTKLDTTGKNHQDLIDEVVGKTRREGELLRGHVERMETVRTKKPAIEKVSPKAKKTTWVHRIPIAGKFLKADIPVLSYPTYTEQYREHIDFKNETLERFREFNQALNKQYFNDEWQKEHLSEPDFEKYKDLADEFKSGMETYVENHLEYFMDNVRKADWLKEELEGLRDRLVSRYRKYANKDGFIDLPELTDMRKRSERYMNLVRLINSGKNIEAIAKQAEYQEFFRRDMFKKSMEIAADQLTEDMVKNGSEAALVKKVQELTGKGPMSYREALSEFKDILDEKTDAGVKEAVQALKDFNEAINGERAEILELADISPPSIHGEVRTQRELIVNRFIVPDAEENPDDHIIAEFMSTDRDSRDMILKGRREELFRAIQNIKTHYRKKYDKDYKRSVPREVSRLTTNKKNPDKPTRHQRIARLLAMLTLAREAEWVVKNLDKNEAYKNEKLADGLKKTVPEGVPPKIDMGFRDVNKLHSTRYVSRLSRGGFNGRDLALNGGKILAGITLMANLMQARKQKKLGAFFTNPYIYASAGAIWGIHKYQQNPEIKNYLFETEGGQERIATHLSLSGLAKKTGYRRLKGFIGSADEWNAMKKIMEQPKAGVKQLEQLRKKARKRDPDRPALTKDDLREAIGDDAVWRKLPKKGNDRMRFLFYEKFLQTPRNIRQLRGYCKTWK